ncbi:peptidylprolyl isomerase [Sphingomonas sp. OK281]|uniref:peptidylprolyl isomerase n=1 Tax=Sphingomonas sp. OK281 TaxID=1881067 RepID=UPI0008EAD290|nr:peptidylprolyl isomerase [Sphingomonas sp. OK281]SFO19560.1 peptidyl-prolyl cis-trans isomerase A (cyclophilin A) [Sphingomonas sp. OK281]
MISRFVTLALAVVGAVSVSAQEAPPPPVVPATVSIVMTTSEGPITLALEKERAPLTTANFLRYVDQKRLDGVTFYRAMKLGADSGLIQGGPQGEVKRLLPPVKHEPTSQTGLSHVDATISMARFAPGSATADFFITVGPVLSLDANPAGSGDTAGFAAFGHVVEGMDVVKRILAAPTSPTAGVGVMKGQMIAAPVKILTVRRVK